MISCCFMIVLCIIVCQVQRGLLGVICYGTHTPGRFWVWTQSQFISPDLLFLYFIRSDPVTADIYWRAQIPGRSQIIQPCSPFYYLTLNTTWTCSKSLWNDFYPLNFSRCPSAWWDRWRRAGKAASDVVVWIILMFSGTLDVSLER